MIAFQNVSYQYANRAEFSIKNSTFTVENGQMLLVTGASGCGKSTLMRLANGLCPQVYGGNVEGEILVDQHVLKDTPIAMLSDVVGTLFQDPEEQFFALNVEDELAFALRARGLPIVEIEERVAAAAEKLGITALLKQDIHALSEGQKQKVGLASLLALGVKNFILDEPSANLDVEATDSLAKILQDLKNDGAAILVVDHRLYWLKDVADSVLVMSRGEIVAQGDFSILENPEIAQQWGLRNSAVCDLRKSLPRIALEEKGDSQNSADSLFRASHLSFSYSPEKPLFENLSFAIPRGITALIGQNGAGKTTLARILTGLNKANGDFYIRNQAVKNLMPHTGLVLQNADHQLQMQSVWQEVWAAALAGSLFKNAKRRWVLEEAEEENVAQILADLNLSHLKNRHPQSLSGGEKQRLVIACALAKKPDILILDEPTSGLDGANLNAIAAILQKESERGIAVFLITHDLELLKIATQVLDLSDFQKNKAFTVENANS